MLDGLTEIAESTDDKEIRAESSKAYLDEKRSELKELLEINLDPLTNE